VKRAVLILTLSLVLVLFTAKYFVGAILEPVLERSLSDLFGMKVQMKGLRIDPEKGTLVARDVFFSDPPGFDARPHLEAESLVAHFDPYALGRREVRIGTLLLVKPRYFIERRLIGSEKKTNVTAWVRHMRARKTKTSSPGPWRVAIGKIILQGGQFLFENQTPDASVRRLFFRDLNGSLSNFRYPGGDPSQLEQAVEIEGKFGDLDPAPFWIRGRANFATGPVSFFLEGEVRDGDMLDHRDLWHGLPLEIREGRFDLRSHTLCVRKNLRSHNLLVLKKMKVKPGLRPADLIWGMPLLAAVSFVEHEEEILLKVPVSGHIKDPEFDFARAFRKVFQESLDRRMRGSVRVLANGPAQIARQAVGAVTSAGHRVTRETFRVVGEAQDQVSSRLEGMVIPKRPGPDEKELL